MEPILSKQEIADLLQTIQQGGGFAEESEVPTKLRRHVDYEDISLFEVAIGRDAVSAIPNLDFIIDRFSQHYSLSLSRFLQQTITVEKIGCESKTFEDYLRSGTDYRTMAILSSAPLNCGALATYNPHLCFILLEIMLGGVQNLSADLPLRRATKIELDLLKSPMNLVCGDIDRALKPVVDARTELVKITDDKRLISFANPETALIIYAFTVSLDQVSGTMELVLPVEMFAPYRQTFANLLRFDTFAEKSWSGAVSRNLETLPLTLMAQTGVLELSVKQLIGLEVGDIIPLDFDPGGDLTLLVEGVVKFSGTAGQRHSRRTACITRALQ